MLEKVSKVQQAWYNNLFEGSNAQFVRSLLRHFTKNKRLMKHLEIAHETFCKTYEVLNGKEQGKVKKQIKNELTLGGKF